LLVRKWFRAPINDVYCGLRGFTKPMYERLDQRCTGMEFATEMFGIRGDGWESSPCRGETFIANACKGRKAL